MNCKNVVLQLEQLFQEYGQPDIHDSDQIRKIRVIAIFEVNDEEVIL